jgi:hypothetical protein
MDEAMVPTDYHRSGLITDDKLKSIFNKLRREASCMIFMDCCHSGERPTPHPPVIWSTHSPTALHPDSHRPLAMHL